MNSIKQKFERIKISEINYTNDQEVSDHIIGHIFIEHIRVHWEEYPTVEPYLRTVQFLNESHNFHPLTNWYRIMAEEYV